MLPCLLSFKAKYGHLNVPKPFNENPTLGTWVNTQRFQYSNLRRGKKSNLTEERITKLDSIGFDWIPRLSGWDEMFQCIKLYKAKCGDCNVPIKFNENRKLGAWVSKQRFSYKMLEEGKKSSITEERIQKLNGIGFQWELFRKCKRSI